MANLILVRHGFGQHNTLDIFAGRRPGIELEPTGYAQAEAVGHRLAGVNPVAAVRSPMLRCKQTMETILEAAGISLLVEVDDRFTEVDYGEWTGELISDKEADAEAWLRLRTEPSGLTFNGGESLKAMGERVAAGVADWNQRVGEGNWLLVSHGDPLKTILAGALGLPFDNYPRLHIDPAGVSVISYPFQGRPDIPTLRGMNLTAGSIRDYL